MEMSIGNRAGSQVFVGLAQEAFDQARAYLEMARILFENGENYLQLAIIAQVMNDANAEDGLDRRKSP
jgi:hypothetical protein